MMLGSFAGVVMGKFKQLEAIQMEAMEKLKTFTCTIKINFNNNQIKAHNKEEYLDILKEQFLDDYGIFLQDDEIYNLTVK